ncbi:hypothetical protein WDW89_14785 [Deltaproteobacteria bacterium TL4]
MPESDYQRKIPTFWEGCKIMWRQLSSIYFSKSYWESLRHPTQTLIDVNHMKTESYKFFHLSDDEIREDLIQRYHKLTEIRLKFLMYNHTTLKVQIMMKNKALPLHELPYGNLEDEVVQGKVMPGDIIFVRGDTRLSGKSLRSLLYVTPTRQLISNANGFHFAFTHVMFYIGNHQLAHFIGGRGMEIVDIEEFEKCLLPYYVVVGPRYPVKDRRKRTFPVIKNRRTPNRTPEEDLRIIRKNEIITTDRKKLKRVIKNIQKGDYNYPDYGYEKMLANYINHVFGRYILTRKRGRVAYHNKKMSLKGWKKIRFMLGHRYLNDDHERPICATAVSQFMNDSGIYSIKHYFDQNKMAGTAEIMFLMCDFDSIQIRAAYMPCQNINID